MLYVQYDNQGVIKATVQSYGAAPQCPNQLVLPDGTPTDGMVVDVAGSGQLVPAPVPKNAGLGIATLIVDMDAEYDLVVADRQYFLDNFTKTG